MEFVKVIVVGPSGEEFSAEIDKDVDEDKLISDLVDALGLDTENKAYAINLIGGSRIRDGITIQLQEIEPSSVRFLKKMKHGK